MWCLFVCGVLMVEIVVVSVCVDSIVFIYSSVCLVCVGMVGMCVVISFILVFFMEWGWVLGMMLCMCMVCCSVVWYVDCCLLCMIMCVSRLCLV